jgi:hypothetical protein
VSACLKYCDLLHGEVQVLNLLVEPQDSPVLLGDNLDVEVDQDRPLYPRFVPKLPDGRLRTRLEPR